ncbi:MAG: hypothetical protein DCC75_13060 [Proteobacteria bacterium]|nr:MAG: hypothetical protein DCC75_13060 [Pseudomonadota bacterium]
MAFKISDPIGKAMYGPLFARLALGAYFVFAGLTKLHNPNGFVMMVRSYNILPEPLATLYGIGLPYLEIGAGGLLVIGLWTTLVSFILSLLLLSFVIALGPYSHQPFNKDIILLGLSLSFLWSGAGALSVDLFRKSG